MLLKILDRFYVGKNDIVIMVDGGLGSQINKYLVGQYIKKKYPDARISYDISWFEKSGMSIDGKDTRNFDLMKIFDSLDFPVARQRACRYLKRKKRYYNEQAFVFSDIAFSLPAYIDGYYLHRDYFSSFDFSQMAFAEKLIRGNKEYSTMFCGLTNPVAVHVRRGDYIGSVHDVLDENYFIEAIKRVHALLPDAHFIFFSNGMDWVRDTILPQINHQHAVLVEEHGNEAGLNDFYLISQCKHQIISNSTFSYFAALLNHYPNKIVVAPKRWMNSDSEAFHGQSSATSLPGWIVL